MSGCGGFGQPCCATGDWATECVFGDGGPSGTSVNEAGGYGCVGPSGAATCGACGGSAQPCCATTQGWASCADGLGCIATDAGAVCGSCGAEGLPCCTNGALPCDTGLGCFVPPPPDAGGTDGGDAADAAVEAGPSGPICGKCGVVGAACCMSGTPCSAGSACVGGFCQ
jgi:hypothetical protein